jgi:ubiquinone/menaquinone biosynthesis C-methylase UbiE
VLEIGCGTGRFARSVIDARPDVDYVATDLSPAMVTATAALGVPAQQASADALPFPDAAFDVVVAAWMLYHVPDLDATLREVRRVLRPGGTLCAATNGDEHLADLLREAGGEPLLTQFSSENAVASLHRHFAEVTQRDIETEATFEDHAAAAAYLRTFSPALAATLPTFPGLRRYAGHTAVLMAR